MYVNCLILKKASVFESTFTYHVPSLIEEEVTQYAVVTVPFNNTKTIALVLECLNKYEGSTPAEDICDIYLNFITDEQIKLISYLHENSFNIINQFLIKLIPAFIRPTSRTLFLLSDEYKTTNDPFLSSFKKGRYLDNLNEETQKLVQKALKSGTLIKKAVLYQKNIKRDFVITFIADSLQKDDMLNDFLIFLKDKGSVLYSALPPHLKPAKLLLDRLAKRNLIKISNLEFRNKPFNLPLNPPVTLTNSHSSTSILSTSVNTSLLAILTLYNDALKANKSLLVLFNTIYELEQFKSLAESLGVNVAVYHAQIANSYASSLFDQILADTPLLIFGLIDSLFLPLQNLGGLVLVYPDSYYYNPTTPNFLGLEACSYLAKIKDIPLYELSFYEQLSEQKQLCLTNYLESAFTLIDKVFTTDPHISSLLTVKTIELIKENLALGRKTCLIVPSLNYANILYCSSCGRIRLCPTCNKPLKYVKKYDHLYCSSCAVDYDKDYACVCGGDKYLFTGFGLERVYEEVKRLFDIEPLLIDSEHQTLSDSLLICASPSVFNSKLREEIDAIVFLEFDKFLNSSNEHSLFSYFKHLSTALFLKENYKLKDIYIETFLKDHSFFSDIRKKQFINKELNRRSLLPLDPYIKSYKISISGKSEAVDHAVSLSVKVLSNSKTITLSRTSTETIRKKKVSSFYLYLPLDAEFKKYRNRLSSLLKKLPVVIKVGD